LGNLRSKHGVEAGKTQQKEKMNFVTSLYVNHPYMATAVSYLIFNGAISNLPEPSTTSSAFYSWFYGFGKFLVGSIGSLIKMKNPTIATDIPGVSFTAPAELAHQHLTILYPPTVASASAQGGAEQIVATAVPQPKVS
jgi:hypothetical protein